MCRNLDQSPLLAMAKPNDFLIDLLEPCVRSHRQIKPMYQLGVVVDLRCDDLPAAFRVLEDIGAHCAMG